MEKVVHRRAYINPQPGFSETAQREVILKRFPDIAEWYVESKRVTRADFIQHLRTSDEAVVASAGCIAKTTGRIDTRLADMADARSDIHTAVAVLVTADDGLSSRRNWPEMKIKARADINAFKNVVNGSKHKHNFTNAELKTMLRIQDSRRYKNDNQRVVALAKEGIKGCDGKPPSRTWRIEKLPIIARERGLEL
jgi:hypothetical protein